MEESINGIWQSLYSSNSRVQAFAVCKESNVIWQTSNWNPAAKAGELLKAVEEVDPEGFFEVICREGDRARVCGVSAIYALLQAMDAGRGELLKYDQAIEQEAQSLVSFAGMAFY